jgi:hypothetical protein
MVSCPIDRFHDDLAQIEVIECIGSEVGYSTISISKFFPRRVVRRHWAFMLLTGGFGREGLEAPIKVTTHGIISS